MGFLKGLFGNREKQSAPTEFEALLELSMRELDKKTVAHQGGWRLGKSKRWDLDISTFTAAFWIKTVLR